MAKRTRQYTGCLRNIEKARDFAREQFVYGVKGKSEHNEISPRAYDDATRQMADWFQECLHTRTVNVRNKVKYLSLSSRDYSNNPLYKIWKACSFTTSEIMFFFFVLDYLTNKTEPVSLSEMHKQYSSTLQWESFSITAAQKWMKNKACPMGICIKNDEGKYSLAPELNMTDKADMLQFYSEIAPAGVIGSFILDKQDFDDSPYSFKQHYAGQAFDSDVICKILNAIKTEKNIELSYSPKDNKEFVTRVFPVKVYSSTQNGRQYLIAHNSRRSFVNFRLDRIKEVSVLDTETINACEIKTKFDKAKKHLWGVSFGSGELTHVEFTIKAGEEEGYIVKRLLREKRCGTVMPVEGQPFLFKFEAEVYDAHEMFPWIRTFIGRIVEYSFSDHRIEEMFKKSISDMYKMYSIEEE